MQQTQNVNLTNSHHVQNGGSSHEHTWTHKHRIGTGTQVTGRTLMHWYSLKVGLNTFPAASIKWGLISRRSRMLGDIRWLPPELLPSAPRTTVPPAGNPGQHEFWRNLAALCTLLTTTILGLSIGQEIISPVMLATRKECFPSPRTPLTFCKVRDLLDPVLQPVEHGHYGGKCPGLHCRIWDI